MNRRNNNEPFSFHSGGCNAVMGDGSVRRLAVNIDIRTLTALATILRLHNFVRKLPVESSFPVN